MLRMSFVQEVAAHRKSISFDSTDQKENPSRGKTASAHGTFALLMEEALKEIN